MRAFFCLATRPENSNGRGSEWSADALAKITWRKELLSNLLAG